MHTLTHTHTKPRQLLLAGSDFLILKPVTFFYLMSIFVYFKQLVFDVVKVITDKFIKIVLHLPDGWLMDLVDGFWFGRKFLRCFPQMWIWSCRKYTRHKRFTWNQYCTQLFKVHTWKHKTNTSIKLTVNFRGHKSAEKHTFLTQNNHLSRNCSNPICLLYTKKFRPITQRFE